MSLVFKDQYRRAEIRKLREKKSRSHQGASGNNQEAGRKEVVWRRARAAHTIQPEELCLCQTLVLPNTPQASFGKIDPAFLKHEFWKTTKYDSKHQFLESSWSCPTQKEGGITKSWPGRNADEPQEQWEACTQTGKTLTCEIRGIILCPRRPVSFQERRPWTWTWTTASYYTTEEWLYSLVSLKNSQGILTGLCEGRWGWWPRSVGLRPARPIRTMW